MLLHRDDVTDALVLQLAEFGVAYFLHGMAAEGLAQRRGAQQAANVIGAERRSALCTHFQLPEKFYSPIDGI
jgi:hypothetical protein